MCRFLELRGGDAYVYARKLSKPQQPSTRRIEPGSSQVCCSCWWWLPTGSQPQVRGCSYRMQSEHPHTFPRLHVTMQLQGPDGSYPPHQGGRHNGMDSNIVFNTLTSSLQLDCALLGLVKLPSTLLCLLFFSLGMLTQGDAAVFDCHRQTVLASVWVDFAGWCRAGTHPGGAAAAVHQGIPPEVLWR